MGKSAGGPQGTSGTQTVVNQSQPPQAFLDAYTNLTQRAQNQSQAPLQQYGGPLVQGFNPQQNQAFGTVQNLQGAYAPYLNSAAQQFSSSTQPLWQSLPSFDTSGLPSAGFGGLTAAQNYAAGAAQPIDVSPYTGMATQAGLAAGYNAPQYANFATTAATGTNPAPYQNLATKPLVTQGYGALPEYLSPYTQNVTNSLQDIFNQQNATQLSQVRGNAAAQGALGGDREAVAEALTAQQQNLAQAPAFSQALQQGFQQAQQALAQQQELQLQQGVNQGQLSLGAGQLGLAGGQLGVSAGLGAGQLLNQAAATQGQLGLGAAGATTQALGTQGQLGLGAGQLTGQMSQAELNEFNQQQQTELAAEQANAWLGQGAGFGLGQLGSSAQNLGLTGAQAEGQMGGIQQQLAQQQLNIPFEQFTQQQAFPYGQLNWLAPMVEGLGAGAGGTSASTSPGPSAISQVAGLGLTGLGTAGLLNQTGAFGNSGWLTGAGGLFGGGAGLGADFAGGVTPLSASALAGIGDVSGLAAGAGGISASDAALAAAFLADGGRISRQGGGQIPSLPDPKFGLSATVPHIGDLSYLQGAQPRGLGMGIPKPPTPSSQPSGLDPNAILKDLTTADSMLKLGKQLAPGEASGGSISPPGLSRGFHPITAMPHLGQAPHLGATGIGLGTRFPRHFQNGGSPAEEYTGLLERHGYQDGGMPDPLVAAAPLQGAPPNTQSLYQQFTQMPMEKLQELSLRIPSTTTQGQLIQRALQAKRMTPQISAQPLSLDTGTMQGTGLADGGRIGLAGGGQTGPAFPGLSPGMSNAQPPMGFFGGAPVSFPNLSAPSTINFPRGPSSFPPASPAPLYQAPLGLYAPSLRPAQNPFRSLAQPQPYLPTSMGGSSGSWPQPFQYNPTSPVTGPAKPSQPNNYQQATAPTLDPGIFTGYGAFGPAGIMNFSQYGVGIPNADIRQFSLPQLSRGGTPFAPALRMGRQEGGEASADIPPETVRIPEDPNRAWAFRSPADEPPRSMKTISSEFPGLAPKEGLSRPIPSKAKLTTEAPSVTIPLGEGLATPPPSAVSSATEPVYNQETGKFEDRPRPPAVQEEGPPSAPGLAPGFARDQEGRLTRNGQPPDTMLPGGIPGWRAQDSGLGAAPPPVSPASASGAGLATPMPKVSETTAPTARPSEQKPPSADDAYTKMLAQISEEIGRKPDTGQQIYSSPWMLPITMGAGMLASRSPFPGQALGEGLLTGTKFLGQQQAELPQNELRRAQALSARASLMQIPLGYETLKAVQAAEGRAGFPTGATAGSATAPPGGATEAGFPAGEIAPNAFLASQRVGFKEELDKNPELKKRLAAIIDLENPQAGTAVAESLMNRMAMSGGTIASGTAGGPESFYGPLRRGEDAARLQELEKDPQRLQARMQQIDQALAGSNLVRGHTDQGSRGDPNYETGGTGVNIAGERFNDWAGHNGVAAAAEWRRQQQAQALPNSGGSSDQVITSAGVPTATAGTRGTQVAQAAPQQNDPFMTALGQEYRTTMILRDRAIASGNVTAAQGFQRDLNNMLQSSPQFKGAVTAAQQANTMHIIPGAGGAVFSPGQGIIAQSPQLIKRIDPVTGEEKTVPAYPVMAGSAGNQQPQANVPAPPGIVRPIPGSAPNPQDHPPSEGWVTGLSPGQHERLVIRGKEEETGRNEVLKAAQSAQVQSLTLARMKEDAEKIWTGKWSSQLGEAQAILRPIAPASWNLDEKVASREDFVKNANALVRQATSEVSKRAAFQEMAFIAKGLPSPDMSPQGLQRVLGEYQGLADYSIAKARAQDAWEQQHQGSVAGFESNWQATAPVTPYTFVLHRMGESPEGREERQQLFSKWGQTEQGKAVVTRLGQEYLYAKNNGLLP